MLSLILQTNCEGSSARDAGVAVILAKLPRVPREGTPSGVVGDLYLNSRGLRNRLDQNPRVGVDVSALHRGNVNSTGHKASQCSQDTGPS